MRRLSIKEKKEEYKAYNTAMKKKRKIERSWSKAFDKYVKGFPFTWKARIVYPSRPSLPPTTTTTTTNHHYYHHHHLRVYQWLKILFTHVNPSVL